MYSYFLSKLRNAVKLPAIEAELVETKMRLKSLENMVKNQQAITPPLFDPENAFIVYNCLKNFAANDSTISILDYEPQCWLDLLKRFQEEAPLLQVTHYQVPQTNWLSLFQAMPDSDYSLVPSPYVTKNLIDNCHWFARISQKVHKGLILAVQFEDADEQNNLEVNVLGDHHLRINLHQNGFTKVSLLNPPNAMKAQSFYDTKSVYVFEDSDSPKNGKNDADSIKRSAATTIPLVYGASRT